MRRKSGSVERDNILSQLEAVAFLIYVLKITVQDGKITNEGEEERVEEENEQEENGNEE